MAIIRPKFLGPTRLDTPEDSGSPGMSEVYSANTLYASGWIDRTLEPTFAEIFRVSLVPVDFANTGEFSFYVIPDNGGGFGLSNSIKEINNNDTLFGTDPPEAAVALGTYTFGAGDEGIDITWHIQDAFSGVIPPKYMVVWKHTLTDGVRTWNDTFYGTFHWAAYTGIQAESV